MKGCIIIKEVNKEIKNYIEKYIFPQYKNNDQGHNLDHINYVINRSLKFAKEVENIDYDMVYTIAAYHDIGHYIDAKNHEKVSADILFNDNELKRYFNKEQIKIMSEAVYDHRASLELEPRSIYGKIVSSADRNTLIEVSFTRTYSYRVVNSPELTLDEIVEESMKHIINKFGNDGYANKKIYFKDEEYKKFLEEIKTLTSDSKLFKKKYYDINSINDVEKNMVFLFDEIFKSNKNISLDEVLYYVYIKLNTDKPFYEIKKQILELKGIDEYEYYTKKVNKELIKYTEENIFPKYEMNDQAHGILHIKEVIRRSFALNQTYKLNLSADMIYAMASCHDINKYIDSNIHEKLASEAFLKDNAMKNFFTADEIKTISEAIEDHRFSKEDKPRSIYGKLVSSADRNTTVDMVFIRSFLVALGNGKNSNRDTVIEDYLNFTFERLGKRYSKENPENMFFEDKIYEMFLKDMRNLLSDSNRFKDYYCQINSIIDITKLVKNYDSVVLIKKMIASK